MDFEQIAWKTIAPQLLDRLAELAATSGKECVFELGLQSIHESSLELLNRNHSFADFKEAVRCIKETGVFEVGAHLIFGIPRETEKDMLASLHTVCELGVDALKLQMQEQGIWQGQSASHTAPFCKYPVHRGGNLRRYE